MDEFERTLRTFLNIVQQHGDYADSYGVDTHTEEGKEIYSAADNWVKLYTQLEKLKLEKEKLELEKKKERNVLIKTCIIGGVVCFCVVVTVNGEVVGNYIARTGTQLMGVLMRLISI